MSWFAFTSGDGRVVGVVRWEGERLASVGHAVAILERPCEVTDWRALLVESADVEAAVEKLLATNGGLRISKTIPFVDASWLAPGQVGEA